MRHTSGAWVNLAGEPATRADDPRHCYAVIFGPRPYAGGASPEFDPDADGKRCERLDAACERLAKIEKEVSRG